MRFFDWMFGRQSVRVIGIILFFLILSSGTSAPQPKANDAEAYYARGLRFYLKREVDNAIADFTKAIEINPRYVRAYNMRSLAYYANKEYDKTWEDVYKAQGLGFEVPSVFLNALRNASGRQR
ncbi:MAG: tetratricopeptide repeat protein [Nitrospirota bacterium]